MTHYLAPITRSLALIALMLLAGCQPKRALPDLPTVDLAGTQTSVREVIGASLVAARKNPNDAALVARLGMALHAHHQLAAATQAYDRAVGLDPTQPDYPYYWGSTLAADGHYIDAVAPLRAALKLRDSFPARLLLADTLYASGQAAEARREYETLLAADESLAAAHYGLGRCSTGLQAQAAFQRAIELFPQYGAARFALAGVYRQRGQRAQSDAALVNYERDKLFAPPLDDPAMAAVQALDASATGLLRASQSLDRQGQLRPAAALQRRALAADPKLAQAWVNLISLSARLHQPEEAEAAYRQAIELEPHNAEAHYNFGVFCFQADRFPQAQKAFEAAVAADPRHAEALDSWGAVVEQSGAWDRAATLYRRAIAAQPSLRLAHFHLGRILANQRRFPEAIAAFEQSVDPIDDQSPGFLYALGATHARASSTAQATARAVQILERARAEAVRWHQPPLAAAIERDLATLKNRPLPP